MKKQQRTYMVSPAPSTPRRLIRKRSPPPPLVEKPLNVAFGYGKNFSAKYELGYEVGRANFEHTCLATIKNGRLKGHPVAVKIISKAKLTTAIAIENVHREVKILMTLTGHRNMVQFYDACEDNLNVYVVMELCEGGELFDRILLKGGRYTKEDAKMIVSQLLSIVAFCHLQRVVHGDLKPENILFTTKDDTAPLKVIDFGLSEFIKLDERLNFNVGTVHYVAPEVLHRSYSMEADVWSIRIISYMLLWARTESGIVRAVLQEDPSFEDVPWPSISPKAKEFVKRLLNKDPQRRMSAAQALAHPWIREENEQIPLDILVYKLVRSYLQASSMKRAALKALSKTLTDDEMIYLGAQFLLLKPNHNGRVSYKNFSMALLQNATDAMMESRVLEVLSTMDALTFKEMDFQEFCAASISVHQLEGTDRWKHHAKCAYDFFEIDGNCKVIIEELAREIGLGPTFPVHVCVRSSDGKLSFIGFTKMLHA